MGKRQLIDITGNTYNYLKVLGFSHMGNRRRSYWNCKCLLCGKEKVLRKDRFAYSYSHDKSCGCWHPIESRNRANKNRDAKTGKIMRKAGN